MNGKDICESLGVSEETLECWAADAENDDWGDSGLWGPVIAIREPTSDERNAMNRAAVLRDRIDMIKKSTGKTDAEAKAEAESQLIVEAKEAVAAR